MSPRVWAGLNWEMASRACRHMAHLSQKLFQLGAVSLQLCNLMAQASHCLHIQYTC